MTGKLRFTGSGADDDLKNFYELIELFPCGRQVNLPRPTEDQALRGHYRNAFQSSYRPLVGRLCR